MNLIKVFLVEDEAIIREGLRDGIPWQQYGYAFVGEASDGEQALPLIRETKPDLILTDIKMPFMDGLELSRLVGKEFPGTKIIILSGYDDFEYARQAITIGVEDYLLKPITKATLGKALQEVAQKIQKEQQQENYLEKFREEIQEYEQFSRRHFFEEVVSGELTAREIYERASDLGMAIHAACYNLILLSIVAKQEHPRLAAEPTMQLRDELTRFFMEHDEYLLVRLNITTYVILVRGEETIVQEATDRCVATIRQLAAAYEKYADWHLAPGTPVERLSLLAKSYSEVSRNLSYRHLIPNRHVLTPDVIEAFRPADEEKNLRGVDTSKISPEVLDGFLRTGRQEEVDDFVREYLDSLQNAVKSQLFCQYLILNVRFTTVAFIETLGCDQEEFLASAESGNLLGQTVTQEELENYICKILRLALDARDSRSLSQSKDLVREAVAYIDEQFAAESISLKEVAGKMNVSANYFSAIFSQQMQKTFVEYLTEKRMERAKELLRTTQKKTAEIAAEVGYKDPHYFSFVFRKTQGMTPRDYRAGGRIRA